MSDGLQRVCPHPDCAHINRPDSVVCVECGRWLVEPAHLSESELALVHEDHVKIWRAAGTSIVGDPDLGDTGQGAPPIPPEQNPTRRCG